MLICFILPRYFQRTWLNKIVTVNTRAPISYPNGRIGAGHNILCKYIFAFFIPYMRMKGIVNKDIILDDSVKSFSKF